MKLKQLIFAALLIVSCISFGFAQTDREKGIELFNKGDYKDALKPLKDFSKKNPQDFEVLYFLGVSFIKISKFKDAENFLGKSVSIKDDSPKSLAAFAYVLILRNKAKKALPFITKSVELDSTNAESFFVLGLANYNLNEPETALKNAERAIKLNPDFANAYLLVAESLMAPPSKGSIINDESRKNKYGKVSDAILKFLSLSPNLSKTNYWKSQSENVKYFAEYYKNNSPTDAPGFKIISPGEAIGVKIISQPKPSFTDKARSSSVSGEVRLLVEFSANGTVDHILVVKQLGYGLDENAIQAAKGIKFVPAMRDGKPVSVVKVVVYSFSVY